MKQLLYCRRTFIAIISIACLTALGMVRGMDVAMALASVAIGLAASNAAENGMKNRGKFIGSTTEGP